MMAHPDRSLPCALALLLAATACSACSKKSEAGAPDAGASTSASIACYTAEQDRCKELSAPSEAQRAALKVECSSGSGALTSPARCPSAKFVGKCTLAGTGTDGQEIRRWYRAEDAAYQQDFCVNSARGAWSATF